MAAAMATFGLERPAPFVARHRHGEAPPHAYTPMGRVYGTNGKREVGRRARQIAAGSLKVSA